MTGLEQFKALVASYGADRRRWPEELRGPAQALLQGSAEARHILAVAAELDEAIEEAGRQEDIRLCPPERQAVALARLRSGVMARIAVADARAGRLSWRERLRQALSFRAGMAAGSGVALAAGFLIGWLSASAPSGTDFEAWLIAPPLDIIEE